MENLQDSQSDSQDKLDLNGSPNPRKARKAYTISKQRENWTDEEHQKFLEALKLYDRDWKKIEKFIGTKSVIQIRSHAQKYFLKVQKNNTGERIPPPRPKRKSTQPYPQKQSKDVSMPWVTTPENMSMNPYVSNPAAFSHWMASNGLLPGVLTPSFNTAQAVESQRQQQEQLHQAQLHLQQVMAAASRGMGTIQHDPLQAPNFSKIYSFLGSLFDPNATNHAENFNEMSPIDRETIQLLMHNLTLNLANHQYREQHSFLLEQYRTHIHMAGKAPESVQQVNSNVSDGTDPSKEQVAHNTPMDSSMNPYLTSYPYSMATNPTLVSSGKAEEQPKETEEVVAQELV